MIIERDIFNRINPLISSPEAIIITGMRRVGKTTLLKYIYDKIENSNKIFIDLENPANQRIFEETDYERIVDNLKFLGLNPAHHGYVFLDEIQFVKNLPSIAKYLIDHFKIKFFMTGSASFYLKNLFSESLSGRKYIFDLYPLSFREFLRLKSTKLTPEFANKEISRSSHEQINRFYDEYIQFGAFPGVVQKDNIEEKKLALNDIFSSYFQLEVLQLGDFKKTRILRDLIFLLMERTGSKIDYTKLSKELGISRATTMSYLDFLENTYFIKTIKPYSTRLSTEIRKMPKCYLCDSGLANQFTNISKGALFENTVFNQLHTKGKINYYQRKNGSEIDFILNKKTAYEVKINPYEQDVTKLKRLCSYLKIEDYSIISKEYTQLQPVKFAFTL